MILQQKPLTIVVGCLDNLMLLCDQWISEAQQNTSAPLLDIQKEYKQAKLMPGQKEKSLINFWEILGFCVE